MPGSTSAVALCNDPAAQVWVLLDSSGLVKRYAGELGRERDFALTGGRQRTVASLTARAKVSSALNFIRCEYSLEYRGVGRTGIRIREEAPQVTLVPLTSAVEDFASCTLPDSSLGSAGTLCIGSPFAAHDAPFVPADPCQPEAVRRRGLAIELVGA
jgi:hypothetical protein